MKDNSKSKLGRREFLGVAATVAGVMILKPELVRGTAANSAVRLGLLGCGGRGTAVATGFVDNTSARVTALGDLFQDALDRARAHFDQHQGAKGYPAIASSQIFRGPRAAEQIAASKEVDAVMVMTPAYFHPEQAEIAANAGKHVYLEKPVGVDVVGAKRVISLGEKIQGKLSLAVGFQIRKAPPYVEMVRRLHAGAIGKIGTGLAYYYCPALKRPDVATKSESEKRLRNWIWYRALSGDIIVEQNVHVIDICNWILQAHPVRAVGAGSRKLRTDSGDNYDNFNVVFTYPNDVHVSFGSTQFDTHPFDAGVYFFGTRGASEAHYDHRMNIKGEEPWDAGLGPAPGADFSAAGTFRGSLDQADPEKQKSFIDSITSGKFLNEARQGAESALSAMLGRNAAYTGRALTWDELVKSDERYDAKLDLSRL